MNIIENKNSIISDLKEKYNIEIGRYKKAENYFNSDKISFDDKIKNINKLKSLIDKIVKLNFEI